MSTNFAQEWKEHLRWKPRSRHPVYRWFDDLVRNEFVPLETHVRWLSGTLRKLLLFSFREVSFYRNRWQTIAEKSRNIRSPADLVRLPTISRREVTDHFDSLTATKLPSGIVAAGYTKSAGTTGPPVTVRTTTFNNFMFTLLWLRQARWFRFDPMAVLCDIRIGREVAGMHAQAPNPDGNVIQRVRWHHLGYYFQTGREVGFNVSNKIEQQIQWLRELQPDYIMSDPGMFEELALAAGGRSPAPSIKALLGVTSQCTESMRRQIERFYGVPIYQTYGLNEIGKVAFQCSAGRYHTNLEHCYVEIVNEEGRRCKDGETGRIVVTALRNAAMPLIRYDTGDLATAVDGPCPCGRTLPSFGDVLGRFRRYAGMTPKTRERFTVIRYAFGDYPKEKIGFVRQFQVHLYYDNRYEIRLCTNGPIPEDFHKHMKLAWAKAGIEPATPLDIVRVKSISRSPSGKLLDFTSDFHDEELGRQ